MPTYINIPIYKNYNTFKNAGLILNDTQSFEELNDPIFQALNAYTLFKSNENFKHIRICIIDEFYLEWLEKNNKEKSRESIVEYINNMTDDMARNLWEKYKLCESIDIMTIAFYVPTDELNKFSCCKLNNDECIEIRDLIINNLNIEKDDLYVPGYITTINQTVDREEDLQLISREYFNSKTKIVFRLLEEQIIDKRVPMTIFCIPVVYKMKIDYIFTEEIIKDMLENDKLVQSISFEEVKKILKKYFNNPEILTDRLLLVCELKDIYYGFLNALRKELKKIMFFNFFKIKKKRK